MLFVDTRKMLCVVIQVRVSVLVGSQSAGLDASPHLFMTPRVAAGPNRDTKMHAGECNGVTNPS